MASATTFRVDAGPSAAQHSATGDPDIPTARELRWPILVVLDEGGEEDPVLELPERVARHLELAAEAPDVSDSETGRPLLTERVWKAVADLYQMGRSTTDAEDRPSIGSWIAALLDTFSPL